MFTCARGVTIRPRYACRRCDGGIMQAAAPDRLIEGGLPTEGTLAHIVVSKYADHLPLYRQTQIYARGGVDLDRSTLADWVGKSTALLEPLAEAIGRHVLAGGAIFVDDTPVAMLAPGNGKTQTARLWAYVRDDRPFGGSAARAVLLHYSRDRGAEHPERHLVIYSGLMQADATLVAAASMSMGASRA